MLAGSVGVAQAARNAGITVEVNLLDMRTTWKSVADNKTEFEARDAVTGKLEWAEVMNLDRFDLHN